MSRGRDRTLGQRQVAGWMVGDLVTVNSRNRNSHGWRGTIDGFTEDSRVRVAFERRGEPLFITFHPNELVIP